MGFWADLANAAVGPLISGVASIFGSNSSKKAQQSANATNLEQTRLTNDANMRIADATNKMNYKIMQENNEFNERMALKMFDLENAYNSPVEQMQRYAAAGLNPAVMMSGGGTGSAQSAPADAATPVGQPATMIAPTMLSGHVSPVQTPTNTLTAFSTVAEVLDKLSSSFKNSIEAKNARKRINFELENLLSQAKYADAQASYVTFQKNLDSAFAPFERQGNLDKIKQDIKTSIADELLKQAQTGVAHGEDLLKTVERQFMQAQATMKENEKDLFIQQMPLLIQQLQETIKLIQEQRNTEKSKQNLNNSQASQTVQMTPYLQNQIDSAVRKNDYDMAVKTLEMIFKANGIGENAITQIPQMVRNMIDKNVHGDDINKVIVDFLGNFTSKK